VTWLVSEKGSSSTGVPKPANAKPFVKRTWLQRHVPQCLMYGVVGKTDYARLGVAREWIDPMQRGIKLVCRKCLLARSRSNTGVSQSAVVAMFT